MEYILHTQELSEYTRILPKISQLNNITMYIDECNSYQRWNHTLWMIVSDNDPYTGKYITISISNKPQIIYNNTNISFDIIKKCQKFISIFYQILYDIANEYIDSDILYDILTNNNWETLTYNDVISLQSTLTNKHIITDVYDNLIAETILRPNITKLSCCIWIEPAGRQTHHNVDRIKFQDSDCTLSTSFYPIKLTSNGAELATCKSPCKASKKIS